MIRFNKQPSGAVFSKENYESHLLSQRNPCGNETYELAHPKPGGLVYLGGDCAFGGRFALPWFFRLYFLESSRRFFH